MLSYFAHNGIEHATAAEAANHDDGPNLLIRLVFSAAILFALFAVIKLLSRKTPASKKKEDKS